ncbi:MAG: metallophosphoesterase family protein [Gaiellaceae bacterium]
MARAFLGVGRVLAPLAAGILVLSAFASAGSSSFRPPKLPPRLIVASVWAVGDGANGSPEARALAARIAASGANLFLYLGDVYPDGTAADFANGYQTTYGRLAPTSAPTPGNHDWPNAQTGYLPWWRNADGVSLPPYYSFAIAGWTIFSLNSEAPHGPGSPQLAWLQARLRGASTCRIAFWHRPRWSGGMHGDAVDVDPLWTALAGHARIVLSGHDHDMQRFSGRNGLVEFVSGAGGAGLYAVDRSHRGLAFANDVDYGALKLVLRPGRAAYSFVTSDGRTLDSGSLRCRR